MLQLVKLLQSKKIKGSIIGRGLPTTGLIGAGVGIGVVFGALIIGVYRYSTLKEKLFFYPISGFAFSEATGLFALMMVFLLCIYISIYIYILKFNQINWLLKINKVIKFLFINSDGKIYKCLKLLLMAIITFYATKYLLFLFLFILPISISLLGDNWFFIKISEMLNPINTSVSSNSGGNTPNPGGNNHMIGNTQQDTNSEQATNRNNTSGTSNSNSGSNNNSVGNNNQGANSQQSTNSPQRGLYLQRQEGNKRAISLTRLTSPSEHSNLITNNPTLASNTPVRNALSGNPAIWADNTPVRSALQANYNNQGINSPWERENIEIEFNEPVKRRRVSSNPNANSHLRANLPSITKCDYTDYDPADYHHKNTLTIYNGVVVVNDLEKIGKRGYLDPQTGEPYPIQQPYARKVSKAMKKVHDNSTLENSLLPEKKEKKTKHLNFKDYDKNTAKYIYDYMSKNYPNKAIHEYKNSLTIRQELARLKNRE